MPNMGYNMSKDVWYKGMRVSKGSNLYALLEKPNDPVSKKAAERLAGELEADFKKRYPQCTEEWFARMNGRDNDRVVSST